MAVVGGCGDGPICPSELVVVIQGPANGDDISGADDKNLVDAGTQVDVVVRSNFHLGDPFVLTVTDENDAVSQFDAVSDGSGNVTFVDVTLPSGTVTLSASGSSDCGTGSDTSEISVQTEADCALTILENPIENEFYAPIPVLNASNDSDGSVPNFQSNLQIQTTPGFTVEAFVLDTGANSEASIGTATADENGVASFATTLAQGRQAVRATCTSGGINEASATNTVHVDTIVPACTLSEPATGVTITPDDDTQGDISDGIQMVWTATVDDAGEADTEGESVSFFRDALEFPGTAVSDTGTTSTDGVAEFTAPGSFAVSVVTQDHAANSCTAGHDVAVILDGCAIGITSPVAVVTVDSNATPGDGVQTDIGVTVGSDCAGETVFVDCGSGEFSATVAASGETTVADVTLSADPESAGTANCTARVTNSDNFQTSDTQPVVWDTEAPGTLLTVTSPAGLDCGESVVLSVGNDFNNDLSDGFQIQVQALASNEISIDLQIVNSAGTTDLPGVGEVPLPVTLQLGSNAMQAFATDAVGNVGTSMVCNVTVSDVIITIDDPAGSGVLSTVDGTVNGGNELELTVCGTVSIANTVNVSLAVGPDNYLTTVTGNNWCTNTVVALAEGNHVFNVDAASTVDARVGSLSLPVAVDLTPPDAPGTLGVTAPTRQEIDATWTASAGAANYILRFRTTAFTDFLNEGSEVAGVGSSLAATISQLRPGQEYFVGVAAVDVNGNVSAPSFAASIVPQFDESPTFIPESSGDGVTKLYGSQIVGGDFDNDTFDDVAVSAPFEAAGIGTGRVYIYFGSATGVSNTAGVVIEGVDAVGPFGDGMTRVSWNTNGIDDLAISSWEANNVYIYDNATISAAKLSGTPPAAPDLTITRGVGSWFEANFGVNGFGFSLTAGQVDGAGTEDLIIGIPFAGPGNFGGAAVVYGGTATSSLVTLSEAPGDVAGMSGLVGRYIENPGLNAFSSMGQFVGFLGDTRAGDAVGDFAFGALTEFETGDHRVYVVRGRTAPTAGSPMQVITFGGNDLEVVLPGSSGTATAFGESFGSLSGGGGTGLRNILISAGTSDSDRGALYLVDGGQTGTLTLADSSDYLAKIAGDSATARFGGAVVNNALGNGADVDGDGLEDLVVAGGRLSNLGVYVWYNGSLPVGDVSDVTRDYFVPRPTGSVFSNSFDSGSKLPIAASWVGDVNGDGLLDICWGDSKRFHPSSEGGVDTDDEGMVVILSDDGV